MGGMRDKAQRPGIGREEQVRDTPEPAEPKRVRSKEESARRRRNEPQRPAGRDGTTGSAAKD
ncbi:hypothetical protein [Streptomyces goshikiensis]|uniref:hypothetical protein n=1 Tax=Streptomyces goshikiensis TaxID=1942 RepID=UPI0036742FB6